MCFRKVSEDIEYMRCGACGNEGKGKFCRHCGAPLQQELEQEPRIQPSDGSSALEEDLAVPIHNDALQVEQPVEAGQAEHEVPLEQVEQVDSEQEDSLVEAEQVEVEHIEDDAPAVVIAQADQAEQEKTQAEADQVEEQSQASDQQTSPQKAMILSSAIAGIMAAIVVIGLAFGLDWAAKQGEFQEDVQYHLLSHVIEIPPEQAAYFIHSVKPGAWLQLMLMHGAEIKGQYGISTGNDMNEPLMFSFQMTLLLSAACAFVLIALASRFIYSIVAKRLNQLWKLCWVILCSLCYALIMGMTLWLLSPKVELLYGNSIYNFELNAELWKVFVLALLLSFVASIVGVGRWSVPQKLDLSQWLKSLAAFARTMLIFFIVIIALMTLSWSTTKPSQLHSTHMTTMGAVWDAYKDDASMYGIIPNVLMQQFIYSLGATWHVDGYAAANLLSMDRPMQLNLVTGASADDADRASLKTIEQDLRLHWFHAAFLLAFLYALSRIQMNKLWSYGCTVLIIIIGVAALSAYANVSLTASNMDEALIGFRFTQSLLSVGIITAIYLIASYIIQRWLARRGDKS